jgi:Rps23 Pro-64 3,4-dihydroxylase Tpa1-like proline 4-hydroxylase
MIHNDTIKVVKNFMDAEEMKFWRDYNDELLVTKQEQFAYYEDGLRPIFQFGKDLCDKHYMSYENLDPLADMRDETRSIFDRVTSKTKEIFENENDLYMASFWFAKQLPGAHVGEHEDTDSGLNAHFKYSAVLYLNDLKITGQLIFTELKHSIKPSAGDLVIFRSKESGRHMVEPIDEDRYTMAMWMTEDASFEIK